MDKVVINNLISGISPDSLIPFFRQKTRTFRVLNEQVVDFTDTDFISFNLIGEFKTTDDELDFVVAMVSVAKELSERGSKKLQYELGKRYLKLTRRYSGGFFVFYDSKGDFRFSFIHEIPNLNGRLTYSNFKRFTYFVSQKQTNKTFIQQLQEANFTSLASIIEAFSVEKVTKQFYQEVATWYFWAMDKIQFPEDYRYSDDPSKDAEIRNSTNLIRLITRIIFIWFLKEKKLVPETLFDTDKLKDIVHDFNTTKQSANYYNTILQNLFFGTLNQPMNVRGFVKEGDYLQNINGYGVKNLYRYANKFKVDPSNAIELFTNIPFLNGGLFDCLDKEDESGKVIYIDGFSRNPSKQAIIPDYLFFQTDEQKVNLTAYKMGHNCTVRGLIEILRSYNFTVDESTPIDQEVALDPELLGKVFEELLANYNPETASTARKATGSFYTPREIVDYMVQQSILQYLKSNSTIDESTLEILLSFSDETPSLSDEQRKQLIELIDNIKILDPACGSGAFPMGILHQMVMLLQKLDPENKHWYEIQYNKALAQTQEAFKNSDRNEREELLMQINEAFDENINFPDYSRKLYLIENCIFGIDIQPIAVQISKLRFFISLVLDQKIDPTKQNYGIRPLPNLETKFVAANTLIALEKLGTYQTEKLRSIIDELKKLRHTYFTIKTLNDKKKLQDKDKKLRAALSDELQRIGYQKAVSEKISHFDPYDPNASADWFDPEWMFGVKVYTEQGRSDGFDIVIGNPPYIQLQKEGGKLAKLYENQKYQTFARTGDIYTLFYEKGLQLLKPGGMLCYITSNKWMRAGYGEKLRDFFTQYNPLLLIDLGPGIFENATVDTNILIIQKSQPPQADTEPVEVPATANKAKQYRLKALTLQKTDKQSITEQVQQNSLLLQKLTKDAWFIGSNAEQQLKEKIERIGKPLKDWDVKIYRGVLTGLNEAFIITTEKRNQILANCRDEAERQRTEALIKPILRGRDIKRYHYEWAGLWVIGTFPALRLNIDDYPALKKYFLDYFDIRQLEQSGKKYPELGFDARKKTGNKWFETQDQIAYYPEFDKEKVVYSEIVRQPQFYFDKESFYVEATSFLMTGKNVKYICGLLNSKPVTYFFKEWYAGGGLGEEGYRYKKAFLENLPLPPITSENQPLVSQIEELVDKILAANASTGSASHPQADTSPWEQEIDELVYQLYGLTEEEIGIIEGK